MSGPTSEDADGGTGHDLELQRAVDEAEADAAAGVLLDHDEVMEKYRRWADE